MARPAETAGTSADRPVPGRGEVAVVVVDHRSGPALARCLATLAPEGPAEVVVVDNSGTGASREALGAGGPGPGVRLVEPGVNLGYGAGANRGVAALGPAEFVLVCNPDLEFEPGSLARLVRALGDRPTWAVAGPRIETPAGTLYPSARPFPDLRDAAGHALVGFFRPDNPFTRRYRVTPPVDGPAPADWVSGACLGLRRSAFEELGGFDESYFMFAEDMDLCWRARQAGWGVGYVPGAVVVHEQGRSTRARPYRMLAAHHRSALRFYARTTRGWRRLLLPLAAALLGVRLLGTWAAQALGRGGR